MKPPCLDFIHLNPLAPVPLLASSVLLLLSFWAIPLTPIALMNCHAFVFYKLVTSTSLWPALLSLLYKDPFLQLRTRHLQLVSRWHLKHSLTQTELKIFFHYPALFSYSLYQHSVIKYYSVCSLHISLNVQFFLLPLLQLGFRPLGFLH